MRWMAVGAVALGVHLWAPAALAEPATRQSALVVRAFDNFGVRADRLQAARGHVDLIFRNVGIGLLWLDCWRRDSEPPGAAPRCRERLGKNDLMLRLQSSSGATPKPHVSMGFSLVSLEDGAPYLATVFVDLVDSVARVASADADLLLGRAIAHEIGHLLLDSNRHPDEGLMRATWSVRQLKKDEEADWLFRDREVAAIRAAVGSRLTTVD